MLVDGALEKIFSVGFSFISGCVFALAYVYTDNNILVRNLTYIGKLFSYLIFSFFTYFLFNFL